MAPAAPTPAEPVTAGLNPLSAVPAPPSEPVTAGLDPLPPAASAEAPPADASAVWPPTKPVQTTLERCELLLTPSMAARGPKGYAWVPVHDFDLVVEQFEERKRARKPSSKLMPPPSAPKQKKQKTAPAPAPVYVPEPEPEPEVLDFTGLSEEEIKQKKKEAKRREKARIMAQLAAISEAKNKLSTVEARAPAPREGKRPVKATNAYGAGDYYTGELSDRQLNAPAPEKKRKTTKQAKRGKDGKVITFRTLKIDEIEENRAFRKKALLRDCRDTLTATRKHKYAWVFGKPVDPVALHIPDYFDIIKEPMDFGTIKERLDKKVYLNGGGPMAFARDMRLVFDNCATYNTADSDAGLMGSTLREEFEKAWQAGKLDEKIAEEDQFRAEEDEIIMNTSNEPVEEEVLVESQQVTEVNRQLAEVQKQLAELQKQQAMAASGGFTPSGGVGGGGGGGGGTSSKRKRPDDDDYFVDEDDFELDEYIPAPRGGSRRGGGASRGRAAPSAGASRGGGGARATGGGALPSRDMTYKEKQDLTELLGELPEDKQARVVQIVAERHAELGGNEDDLIEINIEELDSVTLWKLDRYVRSCLKPKKKKQTQEEMLLEAQRMEQEAERELMQVEASLGVGGHAPPAAEVPAAAPAAAKGNDSDATSDSSSGSDSDSDSDSDSYDSAEGGGSNPKGGNAAAAANGAPAPAGAAAAGASLVEVSSSRPVDDGLALKQNQSKKEVTVQNQAGWANLADKPAGDAPATEAPAVAIPDSLWSDFEAMAQQKSDREKEREAAEAAEKEAAAAKEAAALAEEQRKREAAAEAAEAAKRAEEEAEAAKKRAIEEERARARAELDGMGTTVDMEAQREAMKEFEG